MACTLLAAIVASAVLAACSSNSLSRAGHGSTSPTDGGSAAGSGTQSNAPAANAAPAGQTTVRIGNFYIDKNLKAGPGLDLYDAQQGQAAKPIVTDIAYGSFSAYVHPHETAGGAQPITYLYVLPTGQDPVADKADAKSIGGYQDDGSHLKETIILDSEGNSGSADEETGPIGGLSFSSAVEEGDDANGNKAPIAPPPPAGQGELLVSTHVVTDENLKEPTSNVGYYFFIDSSCTPPLNGPTNTPDLPYVFNDGSSAIQSADAVFAATPGHHQISVVANGDGTAPTCAGLTAKQGLASVDVTAGQQSLVYIYGTSVTDLHLAVAAIQP